MFMSFMQKFVRWLDPKLDKFRARKAPTMPPKYTPTSVEEFIDVISRTPKSVLSTKDRDRIAAVMSFDDRKISELMVPKSKIIFVNANEILGPLMLDKLYKSGFTSFPVVNGSDKVIGVIHTEALNALEDRHTDRAEKYLDHKVYYLHINDSLESAVTEIERTGSSFFLVQDDHNNIAGFFTTQILLDYLLN